MNQQQQPGAALFSALPGELEEEIVYDAVVELFHRMDMDWRDVSEAIDDCSSVGKRIDVLVNWIDSQAFDEEWKEEVPLYVLERYL